MISLSPHAANLEVVTEETRRMAELEARHGYITQVWTWRGGEGVVLCARRGNDSDWYVVVRRGLARGVPRRIAASSISAALSALGIRHRLKSARRSPPPVDPQSRAGFRRRLLPAIHARGNRWRTLRASRRAA